MNMDRFVNAGERRARAANATSDAFAHTEGFYTKAAVSAYGLIETGERSPDESLLNAARIRFFGDGADNSTFDYRIWAWTPSKTNPSVGYTTLIGFGTATLSTLLGSSSANSVVGAAEEVADTLTFTVATDATTPKGPWSKILASLGGSADVYSPANNTSAMLLLPELGSIQGFFFDFDLTGATGANAGVELFR